MAKAAMDQLITLQAAETARDAGGGTYYEWADLATDATVWAAVKAKSGREGMDEGRTNATFVVEFTIYNRTDLTEQNWIVWDSVTYNIRGIRRESGRDLRLVIEAERGVAS